MKPSVHFSLSVGLTFLIGYIIWREVPNWGLAWTVMSRGRFLPLLAGIIAGIVHVMLRAARWGLLLSSSKTRISFKNLLSLTFIKYAINVVPPRSGEIVASIALAKKERISVGSVIAASLLERIWDVLILFALTGFQIFCLGHLYVPKSDAGKQTYLRIQAYAGRGFIAVAFSFVVVILLLRNRSWITRFPTMLQGLISPFLESFAVLGSWIILFKVIAFSFAIWLSIMFQHWCLASAYISGFPFSGALLLLIFTTLGVALPTPAGVGGFQFFMGLALLGFFPEYLSSQDARSYAAGISNGCYLAAICPVLLIGLFFLIYEGVQLKDISTERLESDSS